MTLREQIDEVARRMNAVVVQIFVDHASFQRTSGLWLFHYFTQGHYGSRIIGLPVWPGKLSDALYPQGGIYVSRAERASEHSVIMLHNGDEIEVWPEIRRYEPGKCHVAAKLDLAVFGYTDFDVPDEQAHTFTTVHQGSAVAARTRATTLRARAEGWFPSAPTQQAPKLAVCSYCNGTGVEPSLFFNNPCRVCK